MRDKFKFVHLESPYHTLILQDGQKYFSKIIQARIESYQKRYGSVVFPLGAEDFVCDLVAIERISDQKIVGSFKYISDNICRHFSLPFPLLHTLENKLNPELVHRRVTNYLKSRHKSAKDVAYIGSLTVDTNSVLDQEEKKWIKNLISAGIVLLTNEKKPNEILVTGTIPNHSWEFIEWLGFKKFVPEAVTVWDIGRTTAYIQQWTHWSKEASELAAELKSLWDVGKKISATDLSDKKAWAS